MKNKLKCYMFFMREEQYVKLDSYNINNPSMSYDIDNESLCLYAYTFNKADAQEFKDMRNMDIFKFKVKKADNRDVDEMSRNFCLCELMTLTEVEPRADVDLLVTREEYVSMQTKGGRRISDLVWNFEDYPHNIFKSKYAEVLDILKYRELTCDDIKFDSLLDNTIRRDYMSMFVNMFGRLLRIDL